MPEEVISLNVEGMSCQKCADRIVSAVGELNGVISVAVSMNDKKVIVEYDHERINPELIKAVIDDNGYEVK